MAETKRLDGFCSYIGLQGRAIREVYAEIEEVQFQFNEIYRQKMAEWQAAMNKGVPMLIGGAEPPPIVAQSLLRVIAEEHAKLEKEIADLTAQVSQKRAEADGAIAEAQAELAALRKENPRLDAEEEQIKASRQASQERLQQLEAEIKRTGWLSFRRRGQLKRQREQERQALVQATTQLRRVRQAWEDDKKVYQQNQVRLHAQFDQAGVEAAQLQARLDYLRGNLEQLGRQNGAGRYLAELQAVPEVPEPLRQALAQMVELNRVKAEYEEGLRTVAEGLGLLKGLSEGMDRFSQSAGKVLEEQRQYSLKELKVRLSDEVLAFHALWPEFRNQVKDEKGLGTHPTEFSKRVNAIIKERLGDAAIAGMFNSLGDALTEATRAWG